MFAIKYYSQAIQFSKNMERIPPCLMPFFLNRGISYLGQHDLKQALNNFSKAIERDNSKSASFVNRGITYYQLNEKEKACTDWIQALEKRQLIAGDYIRKYCKSNKLTKK